MDRVEWDTCAKYRFPQCVRNPDSRRFGPTDGPNKVWSNAKRLNSQILESGRRTEEDNLRLSLFSLFRPDEFRIIAQETSVVWCCERALRRRKKKLRDIRRIRTRSKSIDSSGPEEVGRSHGRNWNELTCIYRGPLLTLSWTILTGHKYYRSLSYFFAALFSIRRAEERISRERDKI